MIAVILESGEPTRLYTALSLLVSAAADGREARGLVSFGALPVMLDDTVDTINGGDVFGRSFADLRDTAAQLPLCRLEVCSAAVAAGGADRGVVESRIGPITSTPQFLAEVQGWQLVVV